MDEESSRKILSLFSNLEQSVQITASTWPVSMHMIVPSLSRSKWRQSTRILCETFNGVPGIKNGHSLGQSSVISGNNMQPILRPLETYLIQCSDGISFFPLNLFLMFSYYWPWKQLKMVRFNIEHPSLNMFNLSALHFSHRSKNLDRSIFFIPSLLDDFFKIHWRSISDNNLRGDHRPNGLPSPRNPHQRIRCERTQT